MTQHLYSLPVGLCDHSFGFRNERTSVY